MSTQRDPRHFYRGLLAILLVVAGLVTATRSLQAQQIDVRPTLAGFAAQFDREALEPDVMFREENRELRLGVRCAARNLSEFERTLVSQTTMDFVRANGTEHRDATIEIPVVFHVVRDRGGRFDVASAQVQRQIDILNGAFGAHGYRFTLQATRRYKDNKFAKKCLKRKQERKFKQRNAVDPARTLNIYTCRPAQGVLGYASFPSDFAESSSMHGVVLLYASLPGGSAVPYAEGDTAVHEVGHYLGLFHTFEGSCSGAGDRVGDTPSERNPAFGCPVGRDSCPNSPGNDPILNYMDYSDDSCMDRFSTGQENRMDDQVATFRPSLGR